MDTIVLKLEKAFFWSLTLDGFINCKHLFNRGCNN